MEVVSLIREERSNTSFVRYVHFQDGSTECQLDYQGFKTIGRAKLNPIDYHDHRVGEQISFGRALTKIGKKVINEGKKSAITLDTHKGQRGLRRRVLNFVPTNQ